MSVHFKFTYNETVHRFVLASYEPEALPRMKKHIREVTGEQKLNGKIFWEDGRRLHAINGRMNLRDAITFAERKALRPDDTPCISILLALPPAAAALPFLEKPLLGSAVTDKNDAIENQSDNADMAVDADEQIREQIHAFVLNAMEERIERLQMVEGGDEQKQNENGDSETDIEEDLIAYKTGDETDSDYEKIE